MKGEPRRSPVCGRESLVDHNPKEVREVEDEAGKRSTRRHTAVYESLKPGNNHGCRGRSLVKCVEEEGTVFQGGRNRPGRRDERCARRSWWVGKAGQASTLLYLLGPA